MSEDFNMKKTMYFAICFFVVSFVFSCAGTQKQKSGLGEISQNVKKPELLDHKNAKWGKDAPTWVSQEAYELEKLPEYSDVYLFKFESTRAKSLEGVQIWTRDFSVPSEMARTVKTRVESKAAAVAAGDKDLITGYLEDIVKTITDTKLSGFKRVTDYWVQYRYFNEKGEPTGDDYTYLVLYSIQKSTLDRLIRDAINNADEVKPKTEEEVRVRDLVKDALKEGI